MSVYTIVIGFVGAFLIGVVNRFETNRTMARILTLLVFLISALCIAAKLGGNTHTSAPRGSTSEPNHSVPTDPPSSSNVSP